MSWQYASSSIDPRHFGQVFGELVAALNERAQAIGAHWTTNGAIAYRPTYYVPSLDPLPVPAAGQQIPWTITGEPSPPEVPDVMTVTAYLAWRDYILHYYSDLETDRVGLPPWGSGTSYTLGPIPWTLTRALDYLSESEITFSEASQWRCAWLEQQYRLTNLMRSLWCYPGRAHAEKREDSAPGQAGTWEEQVDHFNDDLVWESPESTPLNYDIGHEANSVTADNSHAIHRRRTIVDPNETDPGSPAYYRSAAWKSALTYDVWIRNILDPIGDITVARYENNDYTISDPSVQGWFPFVSGVAAGNTDWFSWGDIDTVTVSHPATPEVYYGYQWDGPLYVFHPTFSYKDW